MTWLLRASEVDLLALDDETTAQAVAMAGEQAVALTTDRENILTACAAEIEEYIGRLFYRGLAGSARVCTTVVDLDGPGDVPAIAQLPLTAPVNITNVQRWSDDAAAFQTEPYIVRPLGVLRTSRAGTYRIVASATPTTNYPHAIQEAVARLFAFREISSSASFRVSARLRRKSRRAWSSARQQRCAPSSRAEHSDGIDHHRRQRRSPTTSTFRRSLPPPRLLPCLLRLIPSQGDMDALVTIAYGPPGS